MQEDFYGNGVVSKELFGLSNFRRINDNWVNLFRGKPFGLTKLLGLGLSNILSQNKNHEVITSPVFTPCKWNIFQYMRKRSPIAN